MRPFVPFAYRESKDAKSDNMTCCVCNRHRIDVIFIPCHCNGEWFFLSSWFTETVLCEYCALLCELNMMICRAGTSTVVCPLCEKHVRKRWTYISNISNSTSYKRAVIELRSLHTSFIARFVPQFQTRNGGEVMYPLINADAYTNLSTIHLMNVFLMLRGHDPNCPPRYPTNRHGWPDQSTWSDESDSDLDDDLTTFQN